MARSLDVYLLGQFVGNLIQNIHGDMEFRYAKSWLSSSHPMRLSQSLPLQIETFTHRECRGFFGGILPEGSKREIVARNLGISAKNSVAMLEAIGGECAGAVTFIPSGDPLPPQQHSYRPLTDHELAETLRTLPRRPLLAGDEHVRLSLAGAQDKLTVHIRANQVSVPLDGAPSTHIIKPAIDHFAEMVVNELLCMRLAGAIGLPVPHVEQQRVEDIDYLLVERYDRIMDVSQTPARLHQEDFCQALNVASELKYQSEGGPSLQNCFQLLRNTSSLPALDVLRLLDAVIFNFLIGNCDAHGKNFSLLYRTEGTLQTSLAPFYDLFCTIYYPELSQKMAMKIGGEYDAAKVYPRHFERMAIEAGFSPPMVNRRVPTLAQNVKAELPAVTPDHPVGIKTAQIISTRCDITIARFAK